MTSENSFLAYLRALRIQLSVAVANVSKCTPKQDVKPLQDVRVKMLSAGSDLEAALELVEAEIRKFNGGET